VIDRQIDHEILKLYRRACDSNTARVELRQISWPDDELADKICWHHAIPSPSGVAGHAAAICRGQGLLEVSGIQADSLEIAMDSRKREDKLHVSCFLSRTVHNRLTG
jgi:hypothetical protein